MVKMKLLPSTAPRVQASEWLLHGTSAQKRCYCQQYIQDNYDYIAVYKCKRMRISNKHKQRLLATL